MGVLDYKSSNGANMSLRPVYLNDAEGEDVNTSYSPSLRAVPLVTDRVFSSWIYGPSAKRAGHKTKGKKRGSVTYSTDRENEVSKILIISLVYV